MNVPRALLFVWRCLSQAWHVPGVLRGETATGALDATLAGAQRERDETPRGALRLEAMMRTKRSVIRFRASVTRQPRGLVGEDEESAQPCVNPPSETVRPARGPRTPSFGESLRVYQARGWPRAAPTTVEGPVARAARPRRRGNALSRPSSLDHERNPPNRERGIETVCCETALAPFDAAASPCAASATHSRRSIVTRARARADRARAPRPRRSRGNRRRLR